MEESTEHPTDIFKQNRLDSRNNTFFIRIDFILANI